MPKTEFYSHGPNLYQQQRSILKSLHHQIEVVFGPPGTGGQISWILCNCSFKPSFLFCLGKSTLICAVVAAAVPRHRLTIVTSTRNRAVSVIAAKLANHSKWVTELLIN